MFTFIGCIAVAFALFLVYMAVVGYRIQMLFRYANIAIDEAYSRGMSGAYHSCRDKIPDDEEYRLTRWRYADYYPCLIPPHGVKANNSKASP